jgi:hypothetical protein
LIIAIGKEGKGKGDPHLPVFRSIQAYAGFRSGMELLSVPHIECGQEWRFKT